MKEIICISGDLGSGKSTIGSMVAKKLGFEFFSAGTLFRQLAQEKGISILDFNRLAGVDQSLDEIVDSKIIDIGQKGDKIIFDSRMAWHFINDSYKVYLTLCITEAARRILKDPRGSTERYDNIDEAIMNLKMRRQEESKRYMNKYGTDICNPQNYDIVINTIDKLPFEVADIIIGGYREYHK